MPLKRIDWRHSYYVLGLLFLSNSLSYLDRNILSILAEHIKLELSVDDSEIGFLYGTAFAVCYAVFGIPLGRLADRWPRTRLLALGLTLWSGMTALTGLATNFAQLATARFFVGVGEAASTPCSQSLVSDLFDRRRRGGAMGLYLSGMAIGAGAALLVGGAILRAWEGTCGNWCGVSGWRIAFFLVGLPGLVLALLIGAVREPIRGGLDGLAVDSSTRSPFKLFLTELSAVLCPLPLLHLYRIGGLRPALGNLAAGTALFAAMAALAVTVGDPLQWTALGIGLYAIISLFQSLSLRDVPVFRMTAKSPAFVSLIAGVSMKACVVNAIIFWAIPYAMRHFGMAAGEVGLIFGLATVLCSAGGAVFGGFLTDQWRKTDARAPVWIALISLAIIVPVTIVMFTAKSQVLFVVCFVLISLVQTAPSPGVAMLIQEIVVPRMRGQAAALFGLCVTLLNFAIGPYLVGKVSTVSGSLTTGVLAILALAPFAGAGLWTASRYVREAEENRVELARAAGEPI
jgi:MFS family permease